MSPQFKNQLTRLIRQNPYSLDSVLEAITDLRAGQLMAKAAIWSYYYPVTLQKAYDFFKGDETVANDAAFEFMDHFAGDSPAILGFQGEDQQLSKFYDVAAQNFFTNYYNRVVQKEPDIVYGHEQAPDAEEDFGDRDELTHLTKPVFQDSNEDYPYDGIDTDDPETQALREEADYDLKQRVLRIRDRLTEGDKAVYDLLLQDYNSQQIEEALDRSMESVRQSLYRIRGTALEA
jgi:hypothetical protein